MRKEEEMNLITSRLGQKRGKSVTWAIKDEVVMMGKSGI